MHPHPFRRLTLPRVRRPDRHRSLSKLGAIATCALFACATSQGVTPAREVNPESYRLMQSGSHWGVAGNDHVLDDLRPRYPEFFEAILDPNVA